MPSASTIHRLEEKGCFCFDSDPEGEVLKAFEKKGIEYGSIGSKYPVKIFFVNSDMAKIAVDIYNQVMRNHYKYDNDKRPLYFPSWTPKDSCLIKTPVSIRLAFTGYHQHGHQVPICATMRALSDALIFFKIRKDYSLWGFQVIIDKDQLDQEIFYVDSQDQKHPVKITLD